MKQTGSAARRVHGEEERADTAQKKHSTGESALRWFADLKDPIRLVRIGEQDGELASAAQENE